MKNKFEPCKCCPGRTEYSVCRNEAWKENWEDIQKISSYFEIKKDVHMKKIVCLWGGPGTGKSTTCAGLFHKFKIMGLNVEMNREYIKEWVWEGREVISGDQIYITAKQARKEIIYMRKNLDVIITDSPLALTTFYGNIYDKYEREGAACKAIVKQHHMICKDLGYKVDHFFLNRTKPYNPVGRYQDEATAKEYDQKIKQFLDEYPINYTVVDCDDNAEDEIVKLVMG